MSDLEAAFLADIKANPHDWLPRLVFADWLEEQGDPRAELIRLSHDLTRFKCEDRPQKEARLQELREARVEWPTPKLENGLGMEFVLIPPGEFLMGSPEDEEGRSATETQREVILTKGFWLGKFTVTQQEWMSLMETAPWREIGGDYVTEHDRYPATFISWEECSEYCKKFTILEQDAGDLPSGFEYALPTDAQWEYACRAGTTTRFSHGDDLDVTQLGNFAWFNGSIENDLNGNLVGLKMPNSWDLYDMQGNVREWCQELSHFDSTNIDDHEKMRVCRNGAWRYPQWTCRSAFRDTDLQQYGEDTLGFRVALVPND